LLLVAVKHPLVVALVGAALFLLKILRPRRSQNERRSARKASPAHEPKSD
jgi:hypothetical protein